MAEQKLRADDAMERDALVPTATAVPVSAPASIHRQLGDAVPEHALVTVARDGLSVTLRKSVIRLGIQHISRTGADGKESLRIYVYATGETILGYNYTPSNLVTVKSLVSGLVCAVTGDAPPPGVSVVWTVDEPEFVCCAWGWRFRG